MATPFLKRSSESTDLGTIRQLITKHDGHADYRVKRKTSKFHGLSVEDLKRAEDEILRRRGELPQPAQSPLDDASWEGEMDRAAV